MGQVVNLRQIVNRPLRLKPASADFSRPVPGWNGPRKLVEPDELQPAESEHLTYEQIVALIDRTASPAWVRVSQALLGKRTIVLRGALERILSGPQPSSGS